MLSPEEKTEIDRELAQVPERSAACLDALKIVQRARGWVDDEALHDVASYLAMSPAELDSVATFYNLIFRRAVGRHVIYFCDSVSCWLLENERLRDTITRYLGIRFGETTDDGRFTLVPIQCLGCCDQAPALMIDEDLHVEVAPAALGSILEGYR
jgi:NADH-quinone oxidoreductase subunit E